METYQKIEELSSQIKDYVQTRIDILKLQLASVTSKIISNLIASLFVFFLFTIFIVFAGTGLALMISAWIGPLYSGFLIVAAIFLFIAVLFWVKREKFLRIPIMNSIIRQLSIKDEEN